MDFWGQVTNGISAVLSCILDAAGEAQTGLVYLISTAIVGGMGAYFGAAGAQRSINREARLRRRAEAVMTANAAQSIATVIFNQAASLKKQHYLPALETWKKQREEVLEALERGEGTTSIAIHLETPPPVHFPISPLADMVQSKLPLNGRPLAALAEIVQAEHTLITLMNEHGAIRSEFEGKPAAYTVPRYLSLDTQIGRDDRCRDLVHGFVEALDDLLFFSDLLGRDLVDLARRIRSSATRRERRTLPEANTPGKLLPGNEHLIPKRDYHAEWLKNHKLTVPLQKNPIWRRLRRLHSEV